MKAILLALASLIFLDAAHDFNGAAEAGAQKVLFIGNSLTFFHSLPNTVANFTHARIRDVVAPGYTLHQHWDDKVAEKEITKGVWDTVVLQGKSVEFESPDDFYEYGKRFGDLIARTNPKARILLYETFANDGKPQDQPKIHEIYVRLASEIHAQLVPVGDVFYFVHEKDPSLHLWIFDRLHPTAEGTYLAACVFYEVLTQKSCVGLPSTITETGPGEFNDIPVNWSISPDAATHLQQLAHAHSAAR